MTPEFATERLRLRPWPVDDAAAALAVYGDLEVARWLAPAMHRVADESAMRVVLERWLADDARITTPAGRT